MKLTKWFETPFELETGEILVLQTNKEIPVDEQGETPFQVLNAKVLSKEEYCISTTQSHF